MQDMFSQRLEKSHRKKLVQIQETKAMWSQAWKPRQGQKWYTLHPNQRGWEGRAWDLEAGKQKHFTSRGKATPDGWEVWRLWRGEAWSDCDRVWGTHLPWDGRGSLAPYTCLQGFFYSPPSPLILWAFLEVYEKKVLILFSGVFPCWIAPLYIIPYKSQTFCHGSSAFYSDHFSSLFYF